MVLEFPKNHGVSAKRTRKNVAAGTLVKVTDDDALQSTKLVLLSKRTVTELVVAATVSVVAGSSLPGVTFHVPKAENEPWIPFGGRQLIVAGPAMTRGLSDSFSDQTKFRWNMNAPPRSGKVTEVETLSEVTISAASPDLTVSVCPSRRVT